MLSTLGLRVSDPSESSFTQSAKLDALNIAQKTVVNLVHNGYLSELQVIDSNKSMTANALAFSALTSTPIRNGIIAVKKNAGKWATMIDPGDQKKLENTYLAGSATNPVGYVFSSTIYVDGPGATDGIDVWYLKAPAAIGANTNECTLNVSLHEAVVDLAESQLWKMDAKADQAASAYTNAKTQIDTLNARYAAEAPSGIGTKGRA